MVEGIDVLKIGDIQEPIATDTDPTLIPHTIFYENSKQTKILQDMLKDYQLGDHLLLIGNQGVGKNKRNHLLSFFFYLGLTLLWIFVISIIFLSNKEFFGPPLRFHISCSNRQIPRTFTITTRIHSIAQVIELDAIHLHM